MSAFNELMELRPLSRPDNDELEITGSDPVLKTKFLLAETASAALASRWTGARNNAHFRF